MPTLEIVSLETSNLDLDQADYSIAIIEEPKLISHRGLFQDMLTKNRGTIVHLGNPEFRNDTNDFFFAGDLIDWNFLSDTNFHFTKAALIDIKKLLKLALDKSPSRKALFLSDIQFGPKKPKHFTIDNAENFWNTHDREGLRLNSIYEIN